MTKLRIKRFLIEKRKMVEPGFNTRLELINLCLGKLHTDSRDHPHQVTSTLPAITISDVISHAIPTASKNKMIKERINCSNIIVKK